MTSLAPHTSAFAAADERHQQEQPPQQRPQQAQRQWDDTSTRPPQMQRHQLMSPSSMFAAAAQAQAEAAAAAAAAARSTEGASNTSDTQASAAPWSVLSEKPKKLRVAIVTENFLPKVDGVTRTLARLLEHLHVEGHEAMVLGPDTGLTEYAGHSVVGTFGLPLIIYPGLKLNFLRPRFIRRLQQFKPDVIHFVDPIFLGAQVLPAVQKWLPEVPCVASYHTNLPTYATLFGLPFLERTMWKLTRSLHDRCELTFCPSESTRRMLHAKGFRNVAIWSRGVDTELFNPQARDENLRASWGCTPKPLSLEMPLTPSVVPSNAAGAASLDDMLRLSPLQIGAGCSSSSSSPRQALRQGSLSSSSSSYDDSFIRTPPSSALAPFYQQRKRSSISSLGGTELSPPPTYDSLMAAGLPELPGGMGFALPPPAIGPTPEEKQAHMNSLLATAAAAAAAQSGTGAAGGGSLYQIHATAEDSRAVILYVGRISWEKNLRLLIEAFRLLPTSVRERAKLVFVGDGPARGDLTKLCAKHGLDASFMGHQKGKRLAAMYASSSVFAFPSFTETFGQVVLEALASGLPVVGLHAEGTSDLVTHGKSGLLLDINAATSGARSGASSAAAAAAAAAASSRPKASRRDSATTFADAANQASATLLASPQLRPSGKASPRTFAAAAAAQDNSASITSPIPSVVDFARAMQPSAEAFTRCSKSYSILLERLILNRPLRAAMGQRAQQSAAHKTWWDAMNAVVVNYEEVIRRRGVRNLDDEELEALRSVQVQKAPLTGRTTKLFVAAYLLLFIALCYYALFR